MRRQISLITLVVLFPGLMANAALLTAPDCTNSEVDATVQAAGPGDTVVVPAGNCSSWSLSLDKPITLKGSGIGVTTIANAVILITCDRVRVSGFSFIGPDEPYGAVRVLGEVQEWRIDSCEFQISNRAVRAQGAGVIDHCVFHQTDSSAGGVLVHGTPGPVAWQRPAGLGTADAVFVEDCEFFWPNSENDSTVDGCFGARIVFRHNKVVGTETQVHGLCTCDQQPDGRGTVRIEVYDNQFQSGPGTYISPPVCIRGGTAVVFDNTAVDTEGGSWNAAGSISLKHYRGSDHYTDWWGRCDGTNPVDGNLEPDGYPCLDQIGRAPDQDGDGIQDAEPLYEWGNTHNGNDVDFSCAFGCQHVQEGRDYFNDTVRPGYVPFTYPHPLVTEIFYDGFERGDTSQWSASSP